MFSSHCNVRLLKSAAVLFVANIVIRLNVLWPPPLPSSSLTKKNSLNDSFEETVQQAYNAVEYLYLAQKGRAPIAPVVEKPLPIVEERCYCAYCAPKITVVDDNKRREFQFKHWVSNENEPFHLFSAYADIRKNSLYARPSVQVIATAFNLPQEKTDASVYYCNFASSVDQKIAFITRARIRMIWQRGWDPRDSFYNAYLVTCPISNGYLSAFLENYKNELAIVTVLAKKCPTTSQNINFLRVTYSSDALKLATLKSNGTGLLNSKKSVTKIGVCVKGMDFVDNEISPLKMAEWLELQYALGADSVTIYVYHVPTKISKILQHYAHTKRLNVIHLELPDESPKMALVRHEYIWRNQQQKRRHELIPYNDCFYRYSHSHNFVLIVDTDEIIVPLKAVSWPEMIDDLLSQQTKTHMQLLISALSVQNAFVFNGMEREGSIFDSTDRAAIVQERGTYGKSFINTKSVASVFNHFAIHRLYENVTRTMYIDETIALKLHFKRDCPPELKAKCKTFQANTVKDQSLYKFKSSIVASVQNVMSSIDDSL